jgi:phage/plasmid primase-like uncharacterized protein
MAGDSSTHDKEMASRMKRDGIRRTTARCPVCGGVQTIDSHSRDGIGTYERDLYAHIAFRCATGGKREAA